MNWDSIMASLISLGNILLACVCGMAIGWERSKRNKEAGIRTHMVVAMGAALLMVISVSIGSGDPGRIAAQIVSGIGFLGAGMIFFRRESLRGLTTAAGIWATAGIGMAAGAGMYIITVAATLLLVLLQIYFHSRYSIFKARKMHLLSVKFEYSAETVKMLEQEFNVSVFMRFKIYEDAGGSMKAEAVIHTDRDCSATVLANLMYINKQINSFERLEDL